MGFNTMTEQFSGREYAMSPVFDLTRDSCVFHQEEAMNGVEVSLSNDGASIISVQTRDDDECTRQRSFVDSSASACTRRVNNLSPCCYKSDSDSSVASAGSTSSQRSYLQLAIPASYRPTQIDDIDTSAKRENTENPRHNGTKTVQKLLQCFDANHMAGDPRREVFQFKDSQELTYEPKPRPAFRGPRRIKVSIHSRMEWWHHQLSKPVRAIAGSRRKLLRSPLKDCLGSSVANTIARGNTTDSLEESSEEGVSSWADFSSHFSVETVLSTNTTSMGDDSRAGVDCKGLPSLLNLNSLDEGDSVFDDRDETSRMHFFEHDSAHFSVVPDDENNFLLDEYSDHCSQFTETTERDFGFDSSCAQYPIGKQIYVIDFDARTLVTHQGVEGDSTEDDESYADIEWDLG